MRVTGKQVKAFWRYMAKKYDFKIVTKQDAAEMQLIAYALDQMEIQDKKTFLNKYTTTVVLGDWRAVYVPFEIGKGTQAQLISQIVTCVHECQHVVQADRDPLQPAKYLHSDANRAFYEAEAYGVSMEMHFFFTGKMLSAKTLASGLRYYSIGAGDRRIAYKHLIVTSKVVKYGGVVHSTSKVAIRWWKKQLPTTTFRKMSLIKVA